MNIDSSKYVQVLKAKAQEDSGTLSEWNQIVGELTDVINKFREGTTYPPVQAKRIGMLISYIKERGGYQDLRKFRDDVLMKGEKGPSFFWYIVKPKRDPHAK